jgi:hypothetical protein
MPGSPSQITGPPKGPVTDEPKNIEVKPPPAADETARRLIQKTLTDYCAGIAALDAKEVQRVFPTADPRSLEYQFRTLISNKCTLALPPEYLKLDPYAGTAEIKVGVKHEVVPKAGTPGKPYETTMSATLSRSEATGWVILKLKDDSKK